MAVFMTPPQGAVPRKMGCEGLLKIADGIVVLLSNKAAVFCRTGTVNPLTPAWDDNQLFE